MAEVVRKESPVLIENVSLVINVFNIGQHTDLNNLSIGGQPNYRALIQQNGLIQTSTSTTTSTTSIPSTEPSSCLLQKSIGRANSELDSDVVINKEVSPLGWIALLNGDVIPFGVQPTALEISDFGDRKCWKEIRVCLPPSLLADNNETDLYCPVSSCREKLPRNKSMDSHIKKHLGIKESQQQQIPVKLAANGLAEGSLPCPLFYFCHDKKCQYYVETGEKSFKAYKNVKQHYQKVHAPRLFECDQCRKTFSTQKVLESHKLMCGEKYSCSTCEVSYNTLESLQTHCRRKGHTYDHHKYKDKRNSVKQEMQSLKSNVCLPPSAATPFTTVPSTVGTGSRKATKTSRKLPAILPKGTAAAPPEVFNSIQAFCKRAGVKVDLGCQTVCTAFLQKSCPVEASVLQNTSSAATGTSAPTFTQKKRKSTDTQTNIVKFRATCLDQKHNATNTNLDWKKVITSDSQTQTADSCDSIELSTSTKPVTDSSVHFNDVFATFKISESSTTNDVASGVIPSDLNVKKETPPQQSSSVTETVSPEVNEEKSNIASNISSKQASGSSSSTSIKVDSGPSLHPEFISFLEATDSATQTDPEMFDSLGSYDCLGIRGLFGDISAGFVEDSFYVSVSSTASQTAVESVSSKSLSAEDYEALLNTTVDKKIKDLNAFSEYIRSVDGTFHANQPESGIGNGEGVRGSKSGQQHGTNDFFYDWEHIVEEVYRDVGD